MLTTPEDHGTEIKQDEKSGRRGVEGGNLPIFSFVSKSCPKDFVKLPLEWEQKEESPEDWIRNKAQHTNRALYRRRQAPRLISLLCKHSQ